MKKIIAILLVLVIALFSFAACNKNDSDDQNADNPYKPVEKFDEEKLKDTWSQGEITFPNGNKLTIPCTVGEFIEKSGMKTGAASQYENMKIKPNEIINLILNGNDAQVKITCQNKSEAEANYLDMTVTEFNFFYGKQGNRQITVAAGLTVGVTRAEVESALGIPEGKKPEDNLYTYKNTLDNGQKITLIVSFNSSDLVNSISYKLDK